MAANIHNGQCPQPAVRSLRLTADCGPGVKCRLKVKCRLQTKGKMEARGKMQNEDYRLHTRGKIGGKTAGNSSAFVGDPRNLLKSIQCGQNVCSFSTKDCPKYVGHRIVLFQLQAVDCLEYDQLLKALFGGVSTWMGDRPGTTCSRQGLTFTSASSQIKFIRKKSDLLAHYRFRLMRYLALHLFSSELIRLLHGLFCIVRSYSEQCTA